MKTTLTVLVVAVAVALAWALARDPGEQTSLAPPSPLAHAEPDRGALDTDLRGVPREVGAETAVERAEIPEGFHVAEQAPAALDPAVAGTVEVLAFSKESGEPLPGVHVYANSDDGAAVEWVERVEEDGAPITGVEGRASFLVAPGAHVRLWASTPPNGASISRDLGTIESGEARTVRLEFPTQPDAHLVGRVVESGSGAPVAGASIRFLDGSEHLHTGHLNASTELRSGPDGWFETPVSTWSRRHGRVDAQGFGPRLFKLERGHEVRDRALVVSLQRGATLRGLIVGATDFEDLLVRVSAEGYEVADRSGSMFYALGDVLKETSVAEDGAWELTDLPPGAGLQVELWRKGTRVRSEPERIRLQPEEERTLEWRLGGGTTLRGRAVIADSGKPLTHYSIWLVGASEAHAALQSNSDPIARTTTDDDGFFAFEDLSPGEWGVGPAPARPVWKQPNELDVAPMPTQVAIPENAAMVEVELRLHRGLFIRGEILGVDGRRVEAGYVHGHGLESGYWSMREAVKGEFRLGPLVPGTYVLSANGAAETAQSDPVEAQPGDENVVLQLRAGGSIRGTLVDAGSGEPVQGEVRIVPEEDLGRGWSTVLAQADGRFRLDGLSPGSYVVIGSSGDLVGQVRGVAIAPMQSVRDLEVPIEPGAVLLVTYTGESAGVYYRTMSGHAPIHAAQLEPGRASRSVYPAGRVVVVVKIPGEAGTERSIERTVDLRVGEETRVEVGDE
jgi:hypothetical protein